MVRYIIRRLLQAIPLLFLVSVFMFVLIHLLPGGPEQVLFNPRLSAAGRAALRAHFGLDDPVYIQYFKWLGQSLTGNFGFSFANNLPVSQILGQRFPATLELFGLALLLALVLAITLGSYLGRTSGYNHRLLFDHPLVLRHCHAHLPLRPPWPVYLWRHAPLAAHLRNPDAWLHLHSAWHLH